MSFTGTMPMRSYSLRAMMVNSASPLPPAIAPICAEEVETSPATGACTVMLPPSGGVIRARIWPAVTTSPASARISDTFEPIFSGRTCVSSRAIMMPDTSTLLLKQILRPSAPSPQARAARRRPRPPNAPAAADKVSATAANSAGSVRQGAREVQYVIGNPLCFRPPSLPEGGGRAKQAQGGTRARYTVIPNNFAAVRPRMSAFSSSESEVDAKMWSTGAICQG